MAEANGFLWLTNLTDGTITQIDVVACRGIASVKRGVAVGFGSVWVTVAG